MTRHTIPLKVFGLLAAVCLLAGTLAGCGSNQTTTETMDTAAVADYDYGTEPAAEPEYAAEMPAAGMAGSSYSRSSDMAVYDDAEYDGYEETWDEADETALDTGGDDGTGLGDVPEDERKIIKTAYLTVETLEYETTTAEIQQALGKHGAYISSSEEYNSAVGARTANYTVKVPAENYNAFLQAMDGSGNVVSKSENSEDITTQYIDVEARLSSLRAQEDRLMELLEQAGDLETLLLIQDQLTEVQYMIEYYTTTQRSYDRQVAYSTVNIYLYEVVEYTEPEPETYFNRLAQSFKNGWQGALVVVQDIGVIIVGGLPLWIFLAVLVVVIILLARRAKRRRAKKMALTPPPILPVADGKDDKKDKAGAKTPEISEVPGMPKPKK